MFCELYLIGTLEMFLIEMFARRIVTYCVQVNSNGSGLKPIVQQYNSPQPLYSHENVEEVLNQQAEVLANGVKG